MAKNNTWLGLEFIEARCAECNKLLFTIAGFGGIIRIICPRCGAFNQWPVLETELRSREDPLMVITK